jgi:hypothetical protein
MSVAVHEADLQFHHSQARCRLTCEQAAAYDHDGFLHACHFF